MKHRWSVAFKSSFTCNRWEQLGFFNSLSDFLDFYNLHFLFSRDGYRYYINFDFTLERSSLLLYRVCKLY